MISHPVDAVLLDAGGVLVVPNHDLVREALGVDFPDEVLTRAHYEGVAALADFPVENVEVWAAFNRGYTDALDLPPERVESACAVLAELFPQLHVFSQEVPGALDAVRELAATGRKLAIVSNANGQVEELLADIGLRRGEGGLLDAVVDSYLVGSAKPHPRIFEIALEAVGVAPERAIHVGDTFGADVTGALAVGVTPVHVDPLDRCPRPDGHHHVAHLAEVLRLLT